MRVIIINILLLLLATSASAQSGHNYLLFGGNVGYTSLKYNIYDTNSSGGVGIGAKVNYSKYFNENWGGTTGLNVSIYNGIGHLDVYELSFDSKDIYGDDYLKILKLDSWKETQRAIFVEIPILLSYQYQMKKNNLWKFYANAGVKIQIPIVSNYKVETGTLDAIGYYSEYDLYFYDIKGNELSKTDYYRPRGKFDLNTSIAGVINAGVIHEIDGGVEVYGGITFDYGINDMRKIPLDLALISEDDTGIRDYKSILNTDLTSKINTINISLEIGFRYEFSPMISNKISVEKSPTIYGNNILEEKIDTLTEFNVEHHNIYEEISKTEEDSLEKIGYLDDVEYENIIKTNKLDASIDKEWLKDDLDEKLKEVKLIYKKDEYTLDENQKQYIISMISLLDRYPKLKIEIIGHTCSFGTYSESFKRAMKHAMVVYDYFKKIGVSEDELIMISRGEIKPEYTNMYKEGRAKNRRVVLRPKLLPEK